MKLKKVSVILVFVQIVFLTGCWSSREINTLAVTICIGIDKVDDGYLVTEQIVNPKAIASKRATNESPVILYSDTGKDLFEIVRKLTEQSPRRIYNSHLRMVVFGESIANEGIQNILDFFSRNHEFRTDFYFVIAKGATAKNVLSILTPLESIPGLEMYHSIKTSENEWAPTKAIRIIELMNDITAEGENPVISGVEVTEGTPDSNSTDAITKSDQMKRLKFTSLGAFKKDKLIGWLDENESKGYNYITGNVKSTVSYIYYDGKIKITNELKNVKSRISASLINGKPAINVSISVEKNIATVEGDFDITKIENQELLNKIGENKLKSMCEQALSKAKELGTDIFGFGEAIHRKYPKLWKNIKDNWNNEFSDLTVTINVKEKTSQTGQMTKPFYLKEKK